MITEEKVTLCETPQNSLTDVCTSTSMANDYPELFSLAQLDGLLKARHKNGLSDTGAVLKISQKLYINKSIFIDWFMNQKAG